MTELIPFFSEDEQLDENLLRSIETILDDNEQQSGGLCRAQVADNGSAPNSPMPQAPAMNGSFGFGNQVYQKWATNESGEMPTTFNRIYGRNPSRASQFVKPVRKNVTPPPPMPAAMRVNAQIAQYQAMLAEKANQLLMQYIRLNYDGLNAQAQILGIPLEQYIRNLLIALNNQPLLLPNQPLLFAPMNPMHMNTPTAAQQRAFTKQYFNKKN